MRAVGTDVVASSHVSVLPDTDAVEEEYVAEFLLGSKPRNVGLTMWQDCVAVTPGTYRIIAPGRREEVVFWDAATHVRQDSPGRANVKDCAAKFRHLFEQSIRSRVIGCNQTWSSLSGGLDSSSVVCTAQRILADAGDGASLAGTVSIVDSLGDGDERRFSDLVAQYCRIRNEIVRDYWAWQDDGRSPPLTDEPRLMYPFWSRDRRFHEIVRENSGSVLLCGTGSDQYLTGNLFTISDLLRLGHPVAAARRTLSFSVAGRTSFWKTGYRYGVYPLLPRSVRCHLIGGVHAAPDWITSSFRRRLRLEERTPWIRYTDAAANGRFSGEIAYSLRALSTAFERFAPEAEIEKRYPFLDRSLVEFGLSMPAEMIRQPGATKRVLREAMRDCIPEAIRVRASKGGLDARILWSLNREAGYLHRMLRDPVLAQAGWVDPAKLRAAVEQARNGKIGNVAFLMFSLALETWLSVRSGHCQRRARIPVPRDTILSPVLT
jgi:asparagine synthase (glutamine-hydrolysing)